MSWDNLAQAAAFAKAQVFAAVEQAFGQINQALVEHAKVDTKVDGSVPPPKMLPGEQGNVGEAEIEELLKRALGCFMSVRNVSKVGQGHELDLELLSRDGKIRIRIDVKNSYNTYLPEAEINRFYNDVDGLKPAITAGILFMRPGLRTADTSMRIVEKRNQTVVYQIGWWATDLLIETIHEIIVNEKMQEKADAVLITGEKQINEAFRHLSQLVSFQNKLAAKTLETVEEWKSIGAELNRTTAEKLRAAHTLNPNAITAQTLREFEQHIPKRKRGGKPNISNFFLDLAEEDDSSSSKRVKK